LDFKTLKSLNQFTRNCENLSFEYQKIENKRSLIFPYSGIEINEIQEVIKELLYEV